MTARPVSLQSLSARESNIDVLGSSEEFGGCDDLLMFLRMQVSSGLKEAAEMVRKVTKKKKTTMMLMEVFIVSGFSCCFCENRKCIYI